MSPPPPELNVIACQRCRRKKIRCDREKPACNRCRQLSNDCVYDPPRFSKRKNGAKPVSNIQMSAQAETSYISRRGGFNRLDGLENAVRNTAASPVSAPSTNSATLSSLTAFPQCTGHTPHYTGSQTSHASLMDLKGYRFRVDPATTALDENTFISPEIAVAWIQTFYDNQSSLGLLLPFSKEFMLTIPSILDNPYVQVDVRVLILYYGALHNGMLLSPGFNFSEKTTYSLFMYRRTLQYMEQWQLQDQINELSLHVAFWMAHQAYSQLDFDLYYRLHGCTCQIARELGLLQLDAEIPFPSASFSFSDVASQLPANLQRPADTISTVYRDVHRMYFWHILVPTDSLFRHHLYRSESGEIDLNTSKVSLPDASHGESLISIKQDTEVYFEVSLRLSLIELKYCEFKNSSDANTPASGYLSDTETIKIDGLLSEAVTILSEWRVEQSMVQTSSMVNVSLYAHLIWRTTSMIASLIRIQPRSATWPTEQGNILEYEAAHRSIRAMQRMFDFNFDQGDLYLNLGQVKCLFTPCIGILFANILTSTSEELAASDLALMLLVQATMSKCANQRHDLKSLELYVQALNHFAQLVLQQRFPSSGIQGIEARDPWKARAKQAINSDSSVRDSLTGLLHVDELGILHECGLNVMDLYNEPYRSVSLLERSLLTEPDPHRHWWAFET